MDSKAENSLREVLKKKKIKGVLFDMDNTLLNTDIYYIQEMSKAGLEVSSFLNSNSKDLLDDLYVSNRINEIVFDNYRKHLKPELVTIQYRNATKIFLEEHNRTVQEEEVMSTLDNLFNDFYKQSPPIFPSTLRVLHKLNTIGEIKLGVYSHAQKGWTKIKVKNIQKAYQQKYKNELEIEFVVTPIKDVKDSNGWIMAAKTLGLPIENTLIVGDNWNADILAGVYAGCKNLIWIDHRRYISKERMDEISFIKKKAKANVLVVNSIAATTRVLTT